MVTCRFLPLWFLVLALGSHDGDGDCWYFVSWGSEGSPAPQVRPKGSPEGGRGSVRQVASRGVAVRFASALSLHPPPRGS